MWYALTPEEELSVECTAIADPTGPEEVQSRWRGWAVRPSSGTPIRRLLWTVFTPQGHPPRLIWDIIKGLDRGRTVTFSSIEMAREPSSLASPASGKPECKFDKPLF